MRQGFARRHALPLFALPFLAACGAGTVAGQAAPTTAGAFAATGSGATTTTTTTGAAPAAATTTPANALVFQLVPAESTATFRVREQLAGVSLPNDAVGTTRAVSGDLAITPEGSLVAAASGITVDLRELKTDSTRRDGFIKQNTLQTSQFPLAEFVPTAAVGIPSPLPASGEHSFTLSGPMTVHGVRREVTWQTTVARSGDRLSGRATTSVTFSDFGMTAPAVPVVLSVTDEIRLELDFVATLGA